MVDPKQLTEEQLRLQKALDELLEKNSDQLAKQIADNKKINELYKSREARAVKLADFSEIIAQNNKIARLEAQEAARVVTENLERQHEYKEDILKIQQEQQELYEKESKKLKEIDKVWNAYSTAQNKAGKNQSKRAKNAQKERARQLTALNAQLNGYRQEQNALKKTRKQRDEQHAQDEGLLSLQVQKRNTLIQTNDANENLQASTRNFIKTFTGVTDMSDSFLGSLINSDDAVGQIADTMKASFTGPNIAFAVLSKIFQSTLMFMKEFDKLSSDFRKNTGIIDKGFGGIEQRIVNVQRANLRMGVSMDEAFQAANSLTAEMASFTSMTDDAQATVLQATTILQEFGVGAQTTAQIFNNFSKGLGYNANQLERLSTQLMGISTSLKIPPQIIATEFNAASKELMKYGNNMVGVFEGIAEQSKQTGIAMGELLGIVKQFDTFEGAGDAVGKLNAILGGPYLNAINMLYATEDERIKQLRESIQLSGRQFSQLSRFEQQAIATAAGISDMTVAARLFGGTNSEFADTQMSMKEMQERAQKAQAVTEKFTQVMQSFAIALGPVVDILGYAADALLILLNPFGELARLIGVEDTGLISMIGQLTVGFYAYLAVMKLELVPFLTKTLFPAMKKKIVLLSRTQALVGGIVAGFMAFTVIKGIFDDMTSGAAQLTAALVTLAVAYALVRAAMAAKLSGPAAFFVYPVLAGIALAGVYGAFKSIPKFAKGKNAGEIVPGGLGLVAEEGEEMVVTEDGSRYMVNSPSVVALDTQDTVYSNAETKAMMNGSGNNNNTEQLALMRQQQTEFMQSMREERAMLQRSITELANRPNRIELDGKQVYKGQKEYMLKDPNLRIV